ncbi:MAG: DUF1326 domain-containing protein [Actinomycetota bacterium]|nr:DUF1326 domain-containing protein [Actinomycetota bacterium]
MADWTISGTYLEFCNCEPGCGCNFVGRPNSPEGNCEALLGHRIEQGSSDGVDLAGAKVVWALWWPAAIHERDGRGHVYVDCESDEQFEALGRIWRGEEGHAFFEIFNSTFAEPAGVDRAAVDMTVDGKNSRLSVQGVGAGQMEPLRSPVGGEENTVRIVKETGFIWKDGAIATSTFAVDLPEMSWDHSGRHAVFAEFEYSNS